MRISRSTPSGGNEHIFWDFENWSDLLHESRQMWAAFDKNEKTGVRFGMFPAGPMRQAEKEGFTGRELTLALMTEAEKDGGMRA